MLILDIEWLAVKRNCSFKVLPCWVKQLLDELVLKLRIAH